MKEFFGFGGYTRTPEGYFSTEHLLFVTSLVAVMVALAVLLGIQRRKRSDKDINRVLIIAAILIDSLELFKIIIFCIRGSDPLGWLYELPLYLCSIQLITIPIAAFSKGRLREASLDFVLVFGMLGALLGTYFAGNNYAAYPVLSFDNVISGVTHCISGFCSLYIAITGLARMHKRNIGITAALLSSFCLAAYIANLILETNYMFLMRGDGTPYDIVYDLVGGSPIFYPLGVVFLFVLYITAFYGMYHLIRHRIKSQNQKSTEVA